MSTAEERLPQPGHVPPGRLFRSVNERIRALAVMSPELDLDFVCECADPHCFATVRLRAAEFDAVSGMDGCYLVAADHEQPEIDEVVERFDGYVLVSRGA